MTLLAYPSASSASDSAATAQGEAGLDPFIAIRRDLHRHPELAFRERRTSELVADHLASWGYEVSRGIAGTGLVATLERGSGARRLGIRADMDALPINEATQLPYASTQEGAMHACGHDGHTAILLAAAKAIADDVEFSGVLHLIFQPAEEIGAGARRMIADGLFERFPCDAVFGLHNWPGLTAGQFAFVEGPAMAAVDQAHITVFGQGGHGAAPHETIDPVVATASLITALQSVVSRSVDPLEAAVVTVGSIHGGTASNVIPDSVQMKLTLRSFTPTVRDLLEARVPALAKAQAESFGAWAEVDYRRGFPPVVNHVKETQLARSIALAQFGPPGISESFRPRTASEDFAFFLEALPGAFVFVGNGEGPALHSPRYDFNDAILAPAAAFWTRLAGAFLQ